jgi:hypothetical protein
MTFSCLALDWAPLLTSKFNYRHLAARNSYSWDCHRHQLTEQVTTPFSCEINLGAFQGVVEHRPAL